MRKIIIVLRWWGGGSSPFPQGMMRVHIVERGRGIGKEGVPEGGINRQYPGQIPTCMCPRIPQPSHRATVMYICFRQHTSY